MPRLIISGAAERDITDIGDFIAGDNPARARTFIAELRAKAAQAAERPRSFRARDDVAPGLRSTLHGRYVIFFRELPDEVRVVRVLHGARDLGGVFGGKD